MKDEDLHFLAGLLRRRSGMAMPADKSALVESRLQGPMRRFGFRDVASLIRELRLGRDALATLVTEAMTTNETSFFRDAPMFRHVRDAVLPAMIRARAETKRLRIWSAACSSGQEAYSIAMLLDDHRLAAQGWTIDLIATDISSDVLARAENGLYTPFEAQRGLSPRRLDAHFTRDGANWRVNTALRRMVTFRRFNLLDSYGWLDDIDIVFCRNVLMYLDTRAKTQTLEKMDEVLAEDGALILGAAESTSGLTPLFVSGEVPGVYARARNAPPRFGQQPQQLAAARTEHEASASMLVRAARG